MTTHLKKALLLTLVFQLSVSSFTRAAEVTGKPITLTQFLTDPVPPAWGVLEFFQREPPDADQEIQNSPELSKLAATGKAFKDYYLGKLKSQLGEEGSRFATDPEAETLRFIRKAVPSIVGQIETPISEQKASAQALNDTLGQFGFPLTMSLSDLMKDADNDGRHRSAYDFYKRKYFQYLNQDVQTVAPKYVSPEQVKKQIEAEILELRSKNFAEVMRRFGNETAVISLPDKQLSVKYSELAKSEITWLQTGSDSYVRAKKRFGFWVRRYDSLANAKSKKETSLGQEFYKIELRYPLAQKYAVQFQPQDFSVSESSFLALMYNTVPQFENFEDQNRWENRYFVEAGRRDVMLADFIGFLYEKNDASIEALVKRVKAKAVVQKRTRNFVGSQSLTEEIRSLDLDRTDRPLQLIRWGGYSIHPNFWRLRDEIAYSLNRLPFVVKLLGIKDSGKAARQAKKFKKLSSYRLESHQSRFKKVVAKTILYTLLTSLLMGSLASQEGRAELMHGLVNVLGAIKKGGGENSSNEGDKSSKPAEKPKDPTMSNEDDLSQNKNIGADKDPDNPENKGTPIFHLKLGSNVQAPNMYYRLVSGNTQDTESEGIQSGVLAIPWADPPRADEISIETYLSQTPYGDGVLPILTPSGFQLQELGLFVLKDGHKEKLEPGSDYFTYISPKNGLFYVSLNGNAKQSFIYTAHFSPSTISINDSPSFHNLDRSVLNSETERINETGGIELASLLHEEIQSQGSLSLDDMARVYPKSGVYTYAQSGKENWLKIFNEYKAWDKYLKNGVYFYQCSGANQLEVTYFKNYFKQTDGSVAVEPIVGYYLNDRTKTEIETSNGHMQTLVTKLGQNFTYKILDATPSRMDPDQVKLKNYYPGKDPRFEDPFENLPKDPFADLNQKNAEHRKAQEPIKLGRLPSVPMAAPRERLKPVGQENEIDHEDRSASLTPQGPTELEKNIELLEAVKARAFKTIQERARLYTSLSQYDSYNNSPGLKFLGISRIVLETAKQQVTETRAIMSILALNSNISLSRLNSEPYLSNFERTASELITSKGGYHQTLSYLLDVEFSSWTEKIKREVNQKGNQDSPFKYLLDSEIEYRLKELTTLLKEKNWTPPQNCSTAIAEAL